MPVDQTDLEGKIADALNDILELNQKMVSEFGRISRAVGKEGRSPASVDWLGHRRMGRLRRVREQPDWRSGAAIHRSRPRHRRGGKGDLSQTMALEVDGRPLRGEFLHTARVVNTMVQQFNSFASEVTRVAREVGTEGKLGGQAVVPGVAGPGKISRKRQLDGEQSDQPGAQYRGSNHRRGERRLNDARSRSMRAAKFWS